MLQKLSCIIIAYLLVAALASVASADGGTADEAPESGEAEASVGLDTSADQSFDDAFDALLEDEDELPQAMGFPDPIEGANRKVLRFNQGANKWVIGPVSRGYAYVVPDPVRFAIRRFFDNLNAPVTLVNDLLQLEWRDAGVTTGALIVNTTVGIGGFFAPGEKIGLPRHSSDFGQTLALAHVGSGPYLVVPIMGPTNIRDGSGKIVDLFMRPASWFLGFGTLSILAGTGEGIVVMETHQRDLEELERSSVDFYPVLRSAYYQSRTAHIWSRRQHRKD